MLRHAVEPAPHFERVGDTAAVLTLRSTLSGRADQARSRSIVVRVRAWIGRISGRSDRHLLFVLAHATEAIAAQCDSISDRLANQEAILSDVASVAGEELARLRAELLHMTHLASPNTDSPETAS